MLSYPEHFLFWLLSLGLFWFSHAQEVICTVFSENAANTLYSIPYFEANSCEYWWLNSTRHVLATHLDEPHELVVLKNITTLHTSKCLNKVFYKRSCISENFEHMATCIVDCAVKMKNADQCLGLWISIAFGVIGFCILCSGLLWKFRGLIPSKICGWVHACRPASEEKAPSNAGKPNGLLLSGDVEKGDE
ncbi:hypothetical protein LDENG_00291440 [Lucifuga dentata]|nr:hypothetical protein LDENG_00291440 [Lucifuga dentata]